MLVSLKAQICARKLKPYTNVLSKPNCSHSRTILVPIPLRNHGDVVRKSRAVDRQVDGGRGVAVDAVLAVVVRRAQHHDLPHGRAVLLGQVLVRAVGECVRLQDALAGRAERDLDELADGEDVGGGGVARDDRGDADVEALRDALVRVPVDRVVQARAAVDARVGRLLARQQARVVVGLADLGRDHDRLPDVGHDGHVGHAVDAANVAHAAAGRVGDVENGRVLHADVIASRRGVEGARVAGRVCRDERG